MSAALALEHIQEWLRAKNGWKSNQCGVQYEAMPALDAEDFYVAIDDLGTEPGNELTDSLKEIYSFSIGIWKRAEHLSIKDLRGNLKLPQDEYLLKSYTLHDMERAVVVPAGGGLHANYLFLESLNNRYNLPDATLGAAFNRPLFYKGRGRMEPLGVDDGNTTKAWYGYRLRFRGLDREQRLRDSSTQALG
jgi:hypothetical protein